MFCGNRADDWYRAVKRLVDDRGHLEELRREALGYAERLFSQDIAAETILPLTEMAHDYISGYGKMVRTPYRLTMNKGLNFIHLTVSFVKKHKWNTPQMLVKKLRARQTKE